jgi:hypothetical protein
MGRQLCCLSALLAVLMLGGCDTSGPDEKDVLREGAKLVKPLPGLYRSTTRLTAFELPGADPQTADIMRDKFAQVLPQTREYCLTPAAAERGFEDMVRQSQQGDCTFDRFVADETRLSARMRCRSGAELTSDVSVEGTGAPARSHVDLRIVQSGPGIPGGSETIAMSADNQRIGDCPPGNTRR